MIQNNPPDMIFAEYERLDLELKQTKARLLKAEKILNKIQNFLLIFGNYPQSIITIGFLILSTSNSRIKLYMIQISTNIFDEDLVNTYIKLIVAALIIKTSIGIYTIVLRNCNKKRYPKLPSILGVCFQSAGISSLLVPKIGLMCLVFLNMKNTLVLGGLYFTEYITIMVLNKCFWGCFGFLDDGTYAHLCIPAFFEPPKNHQQRSDEESDIIDILKESCYTWLCCCCSPTISKVLYGVLLHIMSGVLYGSFAIYLISTTQSFNVSSFYIAAGCYLLGIALYILFVFLYYKLGQDRKLFMQARNNMEEQPLQPAPLIEETQEVPEQPLLVSLPALNLADSSTPPNEEEIEHNATDHRDGDDCLRCEHRKALQPVIQRNKETNAVVEQLMQKEKFQMKDQ